MAASSSMSLAGFPGLTKAGLAPTKNMSFGQRVTVKRGYNGKFGIVRADKSGDSFEEAKEKAIDAGVKANEAIAEHVKEQAYDAGDKASEAAKAIGDTATGIAEVFSKQASKGGEKASEAAKAAGDKATKKD